MSEEAERALIALGALAEAVLDNRVSIVKPNPRRDTLQIVVRPEHTLADLDGD